MPNLTCPAEHRINLSPLPNPDGCILIRERAIEELIDQLSDLCGSAGESFVSAAFAALSPRNPNILQVYVCPTCGRLAIFDRASDDVPLGWYVREAVPEEARADE